MANVTVMGGVAEEYGLDHAREIQRKHNEEVSSALLNISGIGTKDGAPAHQSAPRPNYTHLGLPMMLYKPEPGEKGEKIVYSPQEKAAALEDGWKEEPFIIKRAAVLDPGLEKQQLLDRNTELQAQVVQQNDLLARLSTRLDAMEKGAKKKAE